VRHRGVVVSGSRLTVGVGVVVDSDGRAREVRSALEWAQLRALAADGVSQREIAARLGINRRTVARLAEASETPRYVRAPAGSMLDPLVAVIRGLLEEWPQIKAPRVTEIVRDDSCSWLREVLTRELTRWWDPTKSNCAEAHLRFRRLRQIHSPARFESRARHPRRAEPLFWLTRRRSARKMSDARRAERAVHQTTIFRHNGPAGARADDAAYGVALLVRPHLPWHRRAPFFGKVRSG
jgi:transcriptional regulator with XRE-family HTH domain